MKIRLATAGNGMSRASLQKAGLYAVLCTLAGLYFTSQALSRNFIVHDLTPWWALLLNYLVGIYIVAALLPVILWPARRWPIDRLHWKSRVMLHLVCSMAFSAADLALAVVMNSWLGLKQGLAPDFWTAYVNLLKWNFHAGMLMYWLILAGHHFWKAWQGFQESRRQLAQAQLAALKSQLQPHFLFNTLNGIGTLVRVNDLRGAERTLGQLADLLRLVLRHVDTQEVPLRQEMDFIRLYLDLECMRFGSRLQVEMPTEPEALDAMVPHMILQPLVENAVRHGVGRSSKAGRITIASRCIEGKLEVRIQDDGPGLEQANGDGLGLRNTRARLVQLYGRAGQLMVDNLADGGAVARVTVPYRRVS